MTQYRATREAAVIALETMSRDGWAKYTLGLGHAPHCIAGLLNTGLHGDSSWPPLGGIRGTYAAAVSAIRRVIPDADSRAGIYTSDDADIIPEAYVVRWNNDEDTTQEEVRRVLCKLAEQAA
jgi:hypothetical protein